MEDPKVLMGRGCLTVLATKAHKMDPSNQHYLLDSSAELAKVWRLDLCSILESSNTIDSIDLFDSKVGHALAPQCNSKWSSATFLGQALRWYIQWLAKCWTCRDHWRSYGWVRLGQVGSIMDGLLVVSWTLRNHIYWFLKLSYDWLSCSFHVAVPFFEVTVVLFFGEIIPSAVFTGSAKPVSQLHGIRLFIDCSKIEHPSEATTVVIGSSVVSVTWQELQSEWCNYVSQKIQAIRHISSTQ